VDISFRPPANRFFSPFLFFFFFFFKVDLDLGNYERFLDIKLTRDNNITTGKIFQVIAHSYKLVWG
jgi:hypothetical protein